MPTVELGTTRTPDGRVLDVAVPLEDLGAVGVSGATGSGKTFAVLAAVAARLMREPSVTTVWIDPHPQTGSRALAWSEAHGRSGVHLDLACAGGMVTPFSPLAPIPGTTPEDRADAFLAALEDVHGSMTGSPVMRELLFAGAVVLAANPDLSLLDFTRLYREGDEGFALTALRQVENPVVHEIFRNIWALSSGARLRAVQSSRNKLSALLGHPGLLLTLGAPARDSIPLRTLLDTPGTDIVVSLHKGRLPQSGPIFARLVLAAVHFALLGREPDDPTLPSVLVLCEEAHNYLTGSDVFLEMLREERKFRAATWFVSQTAQFPDPEVQRVVRTNLGALLVFRTSPAEARDLAREVFPPEDRRWQWSEAHDGRTAPVLRPRLLRSHETPEEALVRLPQREFFLVLRRKQVVLRCRSHELPELPEDRPAPRLIHGRPVAQVQAGLRNRTVPASLGSCPIPPHDEADHAPIPIPWR